MRSLLLALVFAILAALLITGLSKPQALEAKLLNLQVEQSIPQMAAELRGEPAELQALFLVYSDDPVLLAKARLALLRYPDMARPILLNFGASKDFQQVLRAYGEDVTLPIHYFLTNEVATIEWLRRIRDASQSALNAMGRLWQQEGDQAGEAAGNVALSADERAAYAVQFLKAEGYDFLGQFILTPKGEVSWIQTERVLEGIAGFFASGIKGLEIKLRQDDTLAAGDVGWAAVDVAVGVGALKVLRMGRAGAAGSRALSFPQRTAVLGAGLWRGSVIGSRLVKYGAPVVLVYIAIRHPSVINSLLGQAAESLGLPVPLVQFVGWTLVLLPIMLLLRLMLAPLGWLMAGMVGMLRWLDKSLRRSAADGTTT